MGVGVGVAWARSVPEMPSLNTLMLTAKTTRKTLNTRKRAPTVVRAVAEEEYVFIAG
jgi:hypothetical protein